MKKFVVTVMCIVMTVCLYSNFATAKVPETAKPMVTCVNGCSGLSVLICRRNSIYDGTGTHGSCSVKYYKANYRGYWCPTCGNIQSPASLNIGTGLHDCYEIHGSCGRGKVYYCQGGTLGV